MLPASRTTSRVHSGLGRYTAADVARPIVLIGVLASTWTGFSIGGLQVVDLALVSATILIVLDALTGGRRLGIPAWTTIGGVAVLFVAFAHVFVPTDVSYINSRSRLLHSEDAAVIDGSGSSIMIAVRWCVALLILPIVVSYLTRTSSRSGVFLDRVAVFWVVGAAISALVGMLDWVGITNIGAQLIGKDSWTGRQSGLASHANNLGFACAIVAPIAVRLFRTHKVLSVLSLVFLAGGVFVTGSRGGQVGFAVAVIASALILRSGRAAVGWVLVVALVALAVLTQFAPGLFGEDISSLWRFDGAGAAGESDEGRSLLASQAIRDFGTHPLAGVGMPIITHAHSVPLQLIASGGILLAVGMMIYWAGAIAAGIRHRAAFDGISLAAALSVILWLGQALVQNQLVDRYLYVPVAIIAAVSVATRATAKKTS